MPDRCYWIYLEDGTAALIPACWSSVTSGPGSCTCGIEGSRLERAEFERDRLRVALRDALERNVARRLEAEESRAYMRHWRRVLRDHGIDPSAHNPEE